MSARGHVAASTFIPSVGHVVKDIEFAGGGQLPVQARPEPAGPGRSRIAWDTSGLHVPANGRDSPATIDLRVCAIRSGRRWLNVVTRGFLDHRPPRSVPRFRPVTRPHFRAWQVVRPVADLPAVVRGIAASVMRLRPRYVRYVSSSGRPATDIGYSFNELDGTYRNAEYDLWSCHALVGCGSSIFEVVKPAGHDPFELDGMIRSGPNAYDGLPDLVQRFCSRPRRLEVQRTITLVEMIAPLAARFDRERVTSSPGCVTVALRAAADVFVAEAELHWTVAGRGRGSRSVMDRPGSWGASGRGRATSSSRRWASRFGAVIPPPRRS